MRKFSSSTSSSLFSPLPPSILHILSYPPPPSVLHFLPYSSCPLLISTSWFCFPLPLSTFHALSLLSIPPLYFILVSLFSTSPLVLFRDGISIFSRGQILFF